MTFYSVEGLDGSGKSTVVGAITDAYAHAETTSEPSDLQYGQLVRERLSQDTDPMLDFMLFMADRLDHINQRIRPADEAGKMVISDRYADSTRAYQPVALTGDDAPFDSVWHAKEFIEQTMKPWNYEPDLTLYIDISVETALERAAGDEKYEQRQFLTQVRENYEALCDSHDRIIRIDGEQPEDEMVTAALGKLDVASPDRL